LWDWMKGNPSVRSDGTLMTSQREAPQA
jgi:hypothetical protein